MQIFIEILQLMSVSSVTVKSTAFGMRHTNANLMISVNRWGFNGKEKQITQSLNYLDYGARMYDDFLGRWFTQDLLQEKYYSLSSYVFSANNPLRYVDPNGMDWYSYEEKYRDEDDEEQTRTQYKYVRGTMSDKEMEEGGYTHLGKTYMSDNKYYSFGGAIIDYDKDDFFSMQNLQRVQIVDNNIIQSINVAEQAGDFWEKYHNLISSGSDVATLIGKFMEASKGFQGSVRKIGFLNIIPQAIKDINSIADGTMTKEGYFDAIVNIISVAGIYGAATSLTYNTAKAGANVLKQLERETNRYFKQKFNPANWF